MKNLIALILLLSTPALLFISCKKDTGPTGSTGSAPILSLSKTNAKIGEPIYVTSSGQASGSTVKWSTSAISDGRIWTSGSTDSATYLFTGSGSYEVTATYLDGSNVVIDSTHATVTISDSLFGDTSTLHCDAIVVKTLSPDDQINLTPISYSDTGLIFLAHTQLLYSNSPILNTGGNIPGTGGKFEFDFNTTFEYACLGSPTPSPAVGVISFTSLTNGTYALVFKLNGITYQGSLDATNANCSITWNYNSGVTISPLTIQKQ